MSFQEKYDMYIAGHDFTTAELNEQTNEKMDTSINIKNVGRNTFLFWLIKNKSQEVPEFIEKHKEKLYLDIQNISGWTALLFASINSDIDTMRSLISAGADVNMRDTVGHSALLMAAMYSNTESSLEIVQLLIESRASVNIWDIHRQSILMYVVRYRKTTSSLETVEMLIVAGANVNFQNKNKWNALMFAAIDGDIDAANLLIKANVQLDIQDKLGLTVLMYTVRYSKTRSSLDMVRLLIKAGANVNIKNTKGWTALMIAARYSNTDGSLDTVRELIAVGANVNIQNDDKESALTIAGKYSNTTSSFETVEVLIKAGAKIDSKTTRTYLSLSKLKEFLKIEEKINERVKDPDNRVEDKAIIPLYKLKEYLKMEETLNDMEKYAPGNDGYNETECSFEEYLKEMDFIPMEKTLEALERIPNVEPFDILHMEIERSKSLLRENKEWLYINFREYNNITLLHAAAYLDKYDYVQMLLDLGAYPNQSDRSCIIPLQVAAACGNIESVKILAEHSIVDWWDCPIKRMTAKDYAEMYGHTLVVEFLENSYKDLL